MVDKDKPLPPQRQPCDEEAVQRARTALIRMYGSSGVDMGKAVDTADIYMTRWSLDPWTMGAYSAALPDRCPRTSEFYSVTRAQPQRLMGSWHQHSPMAPSL